LESTSSNSSFNHHLRTLRNFYNYLIDEKEYQIKNPFRKVALKYEGTNPQTISRIEFESLLELINEKNGWATYKNRIRKNMYRPYLKFAYRLALYTGRRTEELVSFKWSNIKCNDKNEPLYIESIDLKADRQSNFNQSKATKMVFIPVIPQLKSLIYEMGFNEKRGSNEYLIAPNEIQSRQTIMFQLSKSFTFYYRQLNSGKNISLKHLRKTYLTHLQIMTGKAISISGHSNENILYDHYIDGAEIAKSLASSNIKILN
jgi:integrase